MTEPASWLGFLPPAPGLSGAVWLGLTVAVYACAHRCSTLAKPRPWTNPLFVSTLVLMAAVTVQGAGDGVHAALAGFMLGGDWLMLMLGPAMVALALPLYDQLTKIKTMSTPFLASLLLGSCVSVGSAVGLGWVVALPQSTLWALSTKSITSPMAIRISEQLPSDALLAGGLVVVTGLFGALVAQYVFSWFKIKNKAAQGLAVGIAAHGIGTSLLWRRDPEAAAFAALALVLNGLVTVFTLTFLAGFAVAPG
ncbi:MAG: LrgB family protein [Parvibaculales bacterium]